MAKKKKRNTEKYISTDYTTTRSLSFRAVYSNEKKKPEYKTLEIFYQGHEHDKNTTVYGSIYINAKELKRMLSILEGETNT